MYAKSLVGFPVQIASAIHPSDILHTMNLFYRNKANAAESVGNHKEAARYRRMIFAIPAILSEPMLPELEPMQAQLRQKLDTSATERRIKTKRRRRKQVQEIDPDLGDLFEE